MRKSIVVCIASVLLLASCNQSAEDQKAKADQAQQEANQKIAQAQIEAQQKAQAAQREANEKIAQANAKAQEEASKSQLAANQDVRQANDETLKTRNDYQVETNKSVNQIDNKLDGLKVKAQTTQPKSKVRFEGAMPRVAAQRATVKEDLDSLPKQTAQSFAGYKIKTDKDISDLRKSVDEVAANF
jgi:uncharacterized lipoprotein NlpE involved in copper resistance